MLHDVRETGGMNISARSEYAVRAMLSLVGAGAVGSGVPVSVEQLAATQGLPRKFLESILGDLRRAGLVRSRRGAGGGYLLTSRPDQISVGDVIRAVDGPLAEVRGVRPHETDYDGDAVHLPVVWVAARAALRQVLDGTSLDQLQSGHLPEVVQGLAQEPGAWETR